MQTWKAFAGYFVTFCMSTRKTEESAKKLRGSGTRKNQNYEALIETAKKKLTTFGPVKKAWKHEQRNSSLLFDSFRNFYTCSAEGWGGGL